MASITYTHLELINHNQAACAQDVCLDTDQSTSASPTGTCPRNLPPTSTLDLQPLPYPIESSSDTSTSHSTVYSWLENILCSSSATSEPAKTRQSTGSTCKPRLHSNSGDLHSEPLKSSSRKRKRTEGSSHRPRLTRKALETMESSATLQNNPPKTPQKPLEHPTENFPHDDVPVDFSETSSKASNNVGDIRSFMEQHGMYLMQNKLDTPECALFKDLAYAVVNDQRESAMRDISVRKVQKAADKGHFESEDQILSKLLPLIVKESRFTDDEFDDTGLDVVPNREFKRGYLPNRFKDFGFDNIATFLQKKQGGKNSKPDRVYGLKTGTFPLPKGMMIRDETHHILEIVPTICHGFFVIEGKSSNGGSMAKALLQACRACAVLICAARTLLENTGQGNSEYGPDQRTFVYSCTMDAAVMTFWVNFACVENDHQGKKMVSYYMERIASKNFWDGDNPRIMRMICHNIIEWGVRTRYQALKTMCDAVYRFDNDKLLEEAKKSPRKRKARDRNSVGSS